MIAFDSNILLYGHRSDSPWHSSARELIAGAAEGAAPWAVPWPCLHEFLALATHRRVFSPPSTLAEAFAQIDTWRASPSLVVIGETIEHWTTLRRIVTAARVTGPVIHDARIAAICLDHGVSELLSADRDFSRFPELKTRNPLIRS